MDLRIRSIKIGISSPMEYYRARTYSTKEPETLDWLDKNLKDGDIFYDVGANIGLYSLYAAKLKPSCFVYAFEPESQNLSRLCNNIVLNQLTNVIPYGIALSDRVVVDIFHLREWQAGTAAHWLGDASSVFNCVSPIFKQGVMAASLDMLVKKYHLPSPTLLKIDVDGIEEKILEGAINTLTFSTLRSFLVELNSKTEIETSAVLARLKNMGFAVTSRKVNEYPGFVSCNYIFTRESSLAVAL